MQNVGSAQTTIEYKYKCVPKWTTLFQNTVPPRQHAKIERRTFRVKRKTFAYVQPRRLYSKSRNSSLLTDDVMETIENETVPAFEFVILLENRTAS